MHTAAKSNLILTGSFSLDLEVLTGLPKTSMQGEFYQHLIGQIIKGTYKKQSLIELGNRLVAIADRAYALRQMDVVEQASRLLVNLPLPRDYGSIARYYQAHCIKRSGHFDEAQLLFERAAEEVPPAYKARAIVALGSVSFDSGDYQSALPLYIEAGKAATQSRRFDPLAAFFVGHVLSVMKSIDGNHRGALADLEKMFPFVRAIGSSYPPMYHNYLNSLAVEMIEVGRLEEARNISKNVLATPYAFAYPEWRETGDEIAVRGYRSPKSFVSFSHKVLNAKNVLQLPLSEYGDSTGSEKSSKSLFQQKAKVTVLQEWKEEKMAKKSNGNQKDDKSPQELDKMTNKDLLVEILQRTSKKDMSEKKLRKILEHIIEVESEPDD
jgi:tetratricopeptide (TPR) repeat protein